MTEKELLTEGLLKLNDSLTFIQEMTTPSGKILSDLLYDNLIFAENLLKDMKEEGIKNDSNS